MRVLGGTTEEGLRGILMHEARCCYCHFTLNAQVDGVFTGVLRVHKLGVSVLAEITDLRKRKKEKTNCSSEGVAKTEEEENQPVCQYRSDTVAVYKRTNIRRYLFSDTL